MKTLSREYTLLSTSVEAPFVEAHGAAHNMNLSTSVAMELSILSQGPSTVSDFKLLKLYNFAFGKNWKQIAGCLICLMDIGGERKRRFFTAVGVSSENS